MWEWDAVATDWTTEIKGEKKTERGTWHHYITTLHDSYYYHITSILFCKYITYAFWNEMMIFENQTDKLIFIHAQFLHQSFLIAYWLAIVIRRLWVCSELPPLWQDKFTMILLRPYINLGQPYFRSFPVQYMCTCVHDMYMMYVLVGVCRAFLFWLLFFFLGLKFAQLEAWVW